MTSLDSTPLRSAVGPPDTRGKSVLFCPACSHESPLSGDWVVDHDAGTYCCPECETVVVDRRN